MSTESTTKVLIITDRFKITGEIALYQGARLTDFVTEAKTFIAVSNAEVKTMDGHMVFAAEFLDVHREHIELIVQTDAITNKSYGLGLKD